LTPPGQGAKRWRSARGRGGSDLQSQIQQLVRTGIQTLPDGTLNERIVGAVERELIEQVMIACGKVQVTAAKRLGINRNTLHKKVSDYERMSGNTSMSAQPPAEEGG
jgi:DNA-binding protein Fis